MALPRRALPPPWRRLAAPALAALSLGSASTARAQANAIIPMTPCPGCTLPPTDDLIVGPIPIGFPIKFGGQTYSELYIDSNANVRFGPNGASLLWWQIRQLWLSPGTAQPPLIAAFLADVDTRETNGPSQISYGNFTHGGNPAFAVNWLNVGRYDLLFATRNSVQIVLVRRGGAGDFDILLNYNRVAWEAAGPAGGGFNGVGIVGYYDGESSFELPGSRTLGALLDGGPSALTAFKRNTGVKGSYVLPIRNTAPGLQPRVRGAVLDPDGVPIAGAGVQACAQFGAGVCVSGSTDPSGNYELTAFDPADLTIPLQWSLTAYPPATTNFLPALPIGFTFPFPPDVAAPNLTLVRRLAPPAGTTLEPPPAATVDGLPLVYWQDPLTVRTPGCAGATGAQYQVFHDGQAILTGSLGEVAPGQYEALLPPFAPVHGFVEVHLLLTCPSGPPTDTAFSLYIDPSGFVFDTLGEPIAGARMTLYRSELPDGPFTPLPDGDDTMSPANRANPSFTDARGHFGWDVMAGYYVVRAEKEGCRAPGLPEQPYVETDVLPVPPEWLDLALVLDCTDITPPDLAVPPQVDATATSRHGAEVAYEARAFDGGVEIPIACSPPSGAQFSLGPTQVTCDASDEQGNASQADFEVRVTYAWSDLLPPLTPGGDNVTKVGRKVRIKFALTGESAGITDAKARFSLEPFGAGEALEPEAAPAEPDGARAAEKRNCGQKGELFCYDHRDRVYEYELSTKKMNPGAYRMRIDLGDGVERAAKLTLVDH
jgi:HYR domain-containing protein